MVSPQDLWLWNFNNHPFFKIAILRKEKYFSPERGPKVVKLSKNDCLDMLILLVNFYFPLENVPKGGPLEDFVSFSCWIKPMFFLVFHLGLTDSPLNMIISPLKIKVFAYLETSKVHSSITSAISKFRPTTPSNFWFWVFQSNYKDQIYETKSVYPIPLNQIY